jgi:tetrahydrodipicolinate N-succinyltransferase
VGSLTTNYVRCTREIQSSVAKASAALNNKKTLFISKMGLKLRKFWRWLEKISWTDRVRNEEVLHRVKEERNIVHKIQRRKANWIGHILCRNCLLKHVIEGTI